MTVENLCICPDPLDGWHVGNCMIHGWWADREQRPDDDPPDEIVCDGRDCGGRPHS